MRGVPIDRFYEPAAHNGGYGRASSPCPVTSRDRTSLARLLVRGIADSGDRHHQLPTERLDPGELGCLLFTGQELFQVMLAYQPAAPCLHRPELAGAQEVVDELCGDSQQFSGLVRAVGEPVGEGVALE